MNIKSEDKEASEDILKRYLLEELNKLSDDQEVMLKLSLPTKVNLYQECIAHPRCIRVVALSGGYSREEANAILARQTGMIGSFSRALSEGLQHTMAQEAFDAMLAEAVTSIYEASKSG